jgi:glycosyltransferase involved in cell wall biosynthesis
MKIANIILTSQNGGVEQVFIDYMRIFKKLGHENLAIIKNDAPYHDLAFENTNLLKKTSNKFGFYDFFAIRNIKKYLEEFEPKVLFAHTGRATELSRKAIKKIKKKIILVSINHSMNVKRSIGADLVLSVNKEIFYKTIDQGQPKDRSLIVHNAIEVKDISNDIAKINFKDLKEVTIGGIGRMDDNGKSFETSIKAIKILNEYAKENNLNKKFFLKIAGSGKVKKDLEKLAFDLGVEEQVEFMGWIKHVEIFYNQIDIFCLTSIAETFGLVLLEAMKFKKPIISTKANGPCEILREKKDAIMIDIEPKELCAEKFAKAIIEISSNDKLANSLVENAYKRLKDKFSFQVLENSLKEIVGKVSKT